MLKLKRFSDVSHVCLIGLTGCVLSGQLSAQVNSSSVAPICLEEVTMAHSSNLLWPKLKPREKLVTKCWATVESQQTAMRSGAITLIDVRPAHMAKLDPIDSALLIDRHALVNKQFLRDQSLVLLGTGLDPVDLEEVCSMLRSHGFKSVVAVSGGAPAWRRALYIDTNQFVPLSSEQLFSSLPQGINWRIVASGIKPEQEFILPIKPIKNIDDKNLTDPELIAQRLIKIANEFEGKKQISFYQPILYLPAKGLDELTWQLLLKYTIKSGKSRYLPPIFVLRDGVIGYERYIKQAQAIQQTASFKLAPPCGRF